MFIVIDTIKSDTSITTTHEDLACTLSYRALYSSNKVSEPTCLRVVMYNLSNAAGYIMPDPCGIKCAYIASAVRVSQLAGRVCSLLAIALQLGRAFLDMWLARWPRSKMSG